MCERWGMSVWWICGWGRDKRQEVDSNMHDSCTTCIAGAKLALLLRVMGTQLKAR